MEERTIQTKRGLYGRVNITLPLTLKTTMLAWQKKSGMKKAEFLRLALTTGFLELCKGIPAEEVNRLLTDAEGDLSSWGPEGSESGEGASAVRPQAEARTDGLRPPVPGLS